MTLKSLESFDDVAIVYENDFKVDPIKVMKNATLVKDVDEFVPEYLRITEAEYNLEHAND